MLHGRYPDDVLADFSAVSDLDHIRDGDLTQIARPIDALGLNYYRRHHVRHRRDGSAEPPHCQWPGSPDVELVQPTGPVTDGGWAIEPDGLFDALVAVTRGPPPRCTCTRRGPPSTTTSMPWARSTMPTG